MPDDSIKKFLKELKDKNPEAFDVDRRINSIASSDEFADFVSFVRKSTSEGESLDSYLESMEAFVRGLEGYYANNDLKLPENVNWSVFANILYAATIYE